MGAPLKLSLTDARSFARRAVLLDSPAPTLSAALAYHGYIQLDPLNVCGRMQDLILRNRVLGYREDALTRAIHGAAEGSDNPKAPRLGFEHYIPGEGILAAWPLEAFPYVRAHLERIHPSTTSWPLSPDEEALARRIIAEIAEHGPRMSEDFEHEGRGQTPWGTPGRLVKIVLEKLFRAGRLLISNRRGFRRVYDLPERVLSEIVSAHLPSDIELQHWLALSRVRQRRLVSLRRIDREIIGDLLQEVQIENGSTLFCLKDDVDRLQTGTPVPTKTLLLAPLDPLIYDRKVTRALWDFDFTWEVYTPAAARRRGYYSLPVLAGSDIVGDVEPRADRKKRRLIVRSRRVKRGYKTTEAVTELAEFLNVRYP